MPRRTAKPKITDPLADLKRDLEENKRNFERTKAVINASKEQPTTASGAQREKAHAIPYDLCPMLEMVEAYTRVAEFGAAKYAPWNWSKGLPQTQILASLQRHAWAYQRGEDIDADSGLSHTDHILWNAVALAHAVHHNINDNRRAEPEREYKEPQS